MTRQETQPVVLWTSSVRDVATVTSFLGEQGFTVTPGARGTSRDLYLDTDDWWLYRAGAACRVSDVAGVVRILLEPIKTPVHTVVAPGPLSEELPAVPDLPAPVPGGTLGAWVRRSMRNAPVRVRATVDRESAASVLESSTGVRIAAETALVGVRAGHIAETVIEVRLSLEIGHPRQVTVLTERLAAAFGMKHADGHELVRVMHLAGEALPFPHEDEDLTLRRKDRFVDAAYRVLRRHFDRMRWNEPGTRLGIDPECLHDMRVACRRMREAFKVFREALPRGRAESFRKRLKRLGGALGRVRDLDVYLKHLPAETDSLDESVREGIDVWREHVERERRRPRTAMLKVLHAKHHASLVTSLDRFLSAGPPQRPSAPEASRSVRAVARDVILNRLDKVLRAGRRVGAATSDVEFHRLRIRCKKLRYACEFFSDITGKRADAFTLRVIELQDVLGAHQDAVVVREMLGAARTKLGERKTTAPALDETVTYLSECCARITRKVREDFEPLWRTFDRAKVRKPLMGRLGR